MRASSHSLALPLVLSLLPINLSLFFPHLLSHSLTRSISLLCSLSRSLAPSFFLQARSFSCSIGRFLRLLVLSLVYSINLFPALTLAQLLARSPGQSIALSRYISSFSLSLLPTYSFSRKFICSSARLFAQLLTCFLSR